MTFFQELQERVDGLIGEIDDTTEGNTKLSEFEVTVRSSLQSCYSIPGSK